MVFNQFCILGIAGISCWFGIRLDIYISRQQLNCLPNTQMHSIWLLPLWYKWTEMVFIPRRSRNKKPRESNERTKLWYWYQMDALFSHSETLGVPRDALQNAITGNYTMDINTGYLHSWTSHSWVYNKWEKMIFLWCRVDSFTLSQNAIDVSIPWNETICLWK